MCIHTYVACVYMERKGFPLKKCGHMYIYIYAYAIGIRICIRIAYRVES